MLKLDDGYPADVFEGPGKDARKTIAGYVDE